MGALVLSRFPGERIMIGDDVVVQLVEIRPGGRKARIAVTAPAGVPVHREEVYLAIRACDGKPETVKTAWGPVEMEAGHGSP